MTRRRRLSLRESFKAAAKGAFGVDDPTGGGVSIVATIFYGIWWWIVGVPVTHDGDKHGDGMETGGSER